MPLPTSQEHLHVAIVAERETHPDRVSLDAHSEAPGLPRVFIHEVDRARVAHHSLQPPIMAEAFLLDENAYGCGGRWLAAYDSVVSGSPTIRPAPGAGGAAGGGRG